MAGQRQLTFDVTLRISVVHEEDQAPDAAARAVTDQVLSYGLWDWSDAVRNVELIGTRTIAAGPYG